MARREDSRAAFGCDGRPAKLAHNPRPLYLLHSPGSGSEGSERVSGEGRRPDPEAWSSYLSSPAPSFFHLDLEFFARAARQLFEHREDLLSRRRLRGGCGRAGQHLPTKSTMIAVAMLEGRFTGPDFHGAQPGSDCA